jgi:HD-like signal output (HDOD) protein/prolyl-tRNA editing enzyme YbaK/EbsC (Cys-tRNA(Pro) deacylase)
MSIPKGILRHFEELGLNLDIIEHEPVASRTELPSRIGVSGSQLLRCVILQGASGKYMAVLPSNYLLDYEVLKRLKADDFRIIQGNDKHLLFKDCQTDSHPAIPFVVGLKGLVDESVFSQQSIYIESGVHGKLIKLDQEGVSVLFKDSERMSFACGPEKLYSGKNARPDLTETVNQFTPLRIKQRIDETFDLPAMPDIAQDIMKLRVDPSADAKKLGDIVAKDPSLAAQIISWASSPYYGYKGNIDSIETAVSRVLGFDLVMNLALGISIGKSLNVPLDGPLGLQSYWRHAIYSANLVEKLCRLIPPKQRPERGLAYLAGLLHNFGHLLLGHLFPPQFYLVNRYIESNPGIRIEDIEHFVLGVTHQEIGAWLMKNWHMPDELVVAVRWHHQEEFWSKHAVYSNLVLLSTRLLRRIEMGDAIELSLPQSTLELLELTEDKVNQSFEELLEEKTALDLMAKQLVA